MRSSSRRTSSDWLDRLLIRWHRWWRETHIQTATTALDDAMAFSLPVDDDHVILDKDTAGVEAERLLRVNESERRKMQRHTDKLHRLLDRRHERMLR